MGTKIRDQPICLQLRQPVDLFGKIQKDGIGASGCKYKLVTATESTMQSLIALLSSGLSRTREFSRATSVAAAASRSHTVLIIKGSLVRHHHLLVSCYLSQAKQPSTSVKQSRRLSVTVDTSLVMRSNHNVNQTAG